MMSRSIQMQRKKTSLQGLSSNHRFPHESLHPNENVTSTVHRALSSSGQPLDHATRAFMEPRFGHDFSKVRVHADDQASESAQAVNARAYTVGQDIVFSEGLYAPGT